MRRLFDILRIRVSIRCLNITSITADSRDSEGKQHSILLAVTLHERPRPDFAPRLRQNRSESFETRLNYRLHTATSQVVVELRFSFAAWWCSRLDCPLTAGRHFRHFDSPAILVFSLCPQLAHFVVLPVEQHTDPSLSLHCRPHPKTLSTKYANSHERA